MLALFHTNGFFQLLSQHHTLVGMSLEAKPLAIGRL
jgi:hypothetical protein